MLETVQDKKFVLFLGNNDERTDHEVSTLAEQHNVVNHGLISDGTFVPTENGFYHTTVVDIPWGNLLSLASRFCAIIMLDQPYESWSHQKCLQATCKLMLQLEKQGQTTVFRQNNNVQKILYWIDLVFKKNSSFCIYPWINLYNSGKDTKLCSRDRSTVTSLDSLKNWQTDTSYQKIRDSMLQGRRLPEHCKVCYDYEEYGMESYRQFETVDWATKLDLDSVEDLAKLDKPFFYEVHNGNHCNIKCRGCQPAYSEPIAIEAKKFNIIPPIKFKTSVSQYDMALIDIEQLDSQSSVYFQGGEPTIMPEVKNFLQQCINKKRTDFLLTLCTNGVKLSDDFINLISYFPNTNLSFSIDGYDKVNDYWRWGSKWNNVIENARKVSRLGHSVSINTVPGIYNVTNLHLLMEFLDREFPFTAIYMQVNYLPWQSVNNYPIADLVLESMTKCQKTSIYHSNGKSCKTSIDSIFNYYSTNPVFDPDQLRHFFNYNDQLDQARGSRLVDYIPELDLARQYI